MRITMICMGSTGDVRPYIVLGRELQARGHDIAVCAFADFEKTIVQEGFRFMPIRGDIKDMMSQWMNGSSGVGFLKTVRDSFKDMLDPLLSDLEAACEGAEAIIANYFGQVFQSLAEVRRIPYIQTHYYPMDKNSLTPIASAPGQRAGKVWSLASYPIGYWLVSALEKYYLSDWREARGMTPRKMEGSPCYQLNGHTIPVLYAMSPLIMPRSPRWGENIHMTGYWLDDSATNDYTPDPDLQAFLDAGDAPVYIGFGSMTSGDVDGTLQLVLEAVRQSGVRAVLSTGWGGTEIPSADNVFVANFVPHDWLFTRMKAVVHHGGAGTTAAGILAGKPSLIIPFGGDQPFWASRVEALGVGPKAIPRDKLTVARLSKALTQLTTTKKYSVAARELGQRLRMEQGEKLAADIIEHELRKWLRLEGRDPVIVPITQNISL